MSAEEEHLTGAAVLEVCCINVADCYGNMHENPDFGFVVVVFFSRANDIKTGALIGVDKYGNKYYEETKHYFFGKRHKHCLF